MNNPITSAELDDMLDASALAFPTAFTGKQHLRVPLTDIVYGTGSLDEVHLEALNAQMASGESLDAGVSNLKAIRNTHHRLAACLASGKMNDITAAKVCNYHPQRVSQLKRDPAFMNLIAHYETTRDNEFTEFASAASELATDMLGALQQMLDENPEKFGPGHLMDAIRLLGPGAGLVAPVTKTQNLNVNVDMGDRMLAARERLRKLGEG